MTGPEITAEIVAFPRAGFVIGAAHCRTPGPEGHLMCLLPKGHAGDHAWCDWRGCRVRLPGRADTLPFGGFAY